MRTTTRIAAVALTLLALVAGCGRGDGGEEVDAVVDLDPLAAVEAVGSARISATFDIDISGPDDDDDAEGFVPPVLRVRGTGEGVMAFPDGSSELATEVTAGWGDDESGPSPVQHAEQRRVDGHTWVRMWSGEDEAPSWFELPGSDDGSLLSGGVLVRDPAALLERLRAEAGSLATVGSEEVRGDATTRYRADVDREAVDGGAGLWRPSDGDVVAVDVWIDDQDRLRRVEAGGLTLELWDFGVEVDVAVPDDVTEAPDVDLDSAVGAMADTFPQVTGDWSEQAAGTTAGAAWSVFSAPGASPDGEATTCRTFELGDAEPVFEPPLPIGELPVAMHGATFATCGNGFVAEARGQFDADPPVQVLVPMLDDGPALVAFVVAADHVAGGIRLVRQGAEAVELAVDASGLVVWDGTGSTAITAVELDGGALACRFADVDIPGFPEGGGLVPDSPLGGAGLTVERCTAP